MISVHAEPTFERLRYIDKKLKPLENQETLADPPHCRGSMAPPVGLEPTTP